MPQNKPLAFAKERGAGGVKQPGIQPGKKVIYYDEVNMNQELYGYIYIHMVLFIIVIHIVKAYDEVCVSIRNIGI